MKRLLILLILLLTICSCESEQGSEPMRGYVRVLPTSELLFSCTESSSVLSIESSGDWQVYDVPEWCSVTPESGVDGDEITIAVDGNETDKERGAIIKIRCGTAEATISIVQEKKLETDYVDMGFDRAGTTMQYDESDGTVIVTYANGNIPNIAAGKAIVLPADYKFDIRVIESVSKHNNTLTLATSQGNMCNLFRNTSFTLSTNGNTRATSVKGQPVITPVAMGYYDESGQYIEVYNKLKPMKFSSHTINTTLWSFHKDYNGATLYEGKGGRLWWEKCAFDAGLDGIFNFDFGSRTGGILGIVGELNSFGYKLHGSIGADLLMRYHYENSAIYSDDRILKYNVIPTQVYTFIVSGVTVHLLIYTHLGQYVEFGAEGRVDISGGVNLGMDVEAGLSWSKEHGVDVIKGATPYMNIYHPTIEAEASAHAKLSYYPQIEIGLYGFIGPWFEPRPYLKEKVSAGFRASTDGENYLAFKDEYFSGLDMRMGLKLDFGFWDKEVWKSNVFNVVDDTLLATSPSQITLVSPSSNPITVKDGESVNAEFVVKSYSPITDKYWACDGAIVVFESEHGELSNSIGVTDDSGMARVTWTPTGVNTKDNMLFARIYNTDGTVIDEVQLVANVEPKSERDILIQFYHDTGGDNWRCYHGWCLDKPLEEWYGVTCNNEGRVIGLNLVDNNLSGNGNLSGLTALEWCWCLSNQLTSLDVSGCTALLNLRCSGNQLTSLDMSGCTALKDFECFNSQLSLLDVSECPALESLDCSGNQLTSLDVSSCTALYNLECYDNQLTSLNVSDCTALGNLNCHNNLLTSLDVSDYNALERLWCFNNQLTSLNVLGCTALWDIDCHKNQLPTLDVSGCTSMLYLDCYNNPLASLNLSGCTTLEQFDYVSEQLISLNASGCTSLRSLNCSNNQLTSLKVSGCTALENLYCYDNQLTSLDVSDCLALKFFGCYSNLITSLDVSSCTSLSEFICQNNQLTSLNVSGCKALEILGCGNNQLSSLNLSGCTMLKTISCGSNQLTSLNVSSCTALEELWCAMNKITQVIPDYLDGVDFNYDVRYEYWPDKDGQLRYTDRGVGWWYPGEPGKGYHGR